MTLCKSTAMFLVLTIASASLAQDISAQLAAAEKDFRAADFDAALARLQPLLESDDIDDPTKERLREFAAAVLHQRGEQRFRQARIAESVADFDRQLELQPDRAAEHWQRGIAYYYAGEYERGAKQFELHQTVNPQDVENAAWHFLCAVSAPNGSVEAARKNLIPITRDSRVPMAQIQQMFAGDMTPEEVLRVGEEAGGAAKFYADLYVGLYYEAIGEDAQSLRHLTLAAENPAGTGNYMVDVARVHVALRKGSTPLPQAHSHNDYQHDRPLLDALDHGFCSIEADVFLIDGELLVGHELKEVDKARSLRALYLEPLRERFNAQGRIYPAGPPLTLLIDIKSDGPETYAALHQVLAEYSDMLSVVNDGQFKEGAVTVIISGNRPQSDVAATDPRYTGIDGRLTDLDSDAPKHLLPLISDNWTNHFKWRGEGPMPEEERAKLKSIVAKAHAGGRQIRFWATPESPALWAELRDAGVDYIGTDDLDALRQFLKQRP